MLLNILFHTSCLSSGKSLDEILENTDRNAITLDLSDCKISKFPERILDFENIEELDLSKNEMKEFPIFKLKELKKLKRLYLSNNQIEFIILNEPKEAKLCRLCKEVIKNGETQLSPQSSLQSSLSPCSENCSIYNNDEYDLSQFCILIDLQDEFAFPLEILDLSNNKLAILPSMKNLKSLKTLLLYNNCLKSLSGIESLIELEELSAFKNELSDADVISELKNLKLINLSYNQIENIPNMKKLKLIKKILITNNLLKDVSNLYGRTSSKSIDSIDQSNITTRLELYNPNEQGYFKTLINSLFSRFKSLFYNFNKENTIEYESIPAISLEYFEPENDLMTETLPFLKVLDLSNNRIESIDGLGILPSLKILKLYNNQIRRIPRTIGSSEDLIRINIGRNKLKNVPAEIGNLINLKSIDLSFNQLVNLPRSMENLSEKLKINLMGNLKFEKFGEGYTLGRTQLESIFISGIVLIDNF